MSAPARRVTARRVTGRRALAALAGFFACVFAVNGVFVHLSLTSHPGTVTDDAYREGMRYNRVLERAELQRRLGWRGRIGHEGGVVVVRVAGPSGEAVAGLDATLEVGRPASDAEDRAAAAEETAPGAYRMPGPALAPGRWRVVFDASDGAGRRFRLEGPVMVAP